MNKIILHMWLLLFFFVALGIPAQSSSEQGEFQSGEKETEYIQVVGVTDLRSKFSDGCFSLRTLAEMCVERKIDVMMVMDHDRYSLEYGIFPFRNIIRKKVEKNSLLTNGAANYLKSFETLTYEFNNLIAIPGVESAPFYYWSGGYLSGDITANLWENHISIAGMKYPEDYEELPTLNSNYSTKYFWRHFKGFFLFFVSALVGAVLILFEGYFRIGGIVILLVNLLLMSSYHPFRSSPFDQYRGPQGVAPWQLTIDHANERGGLTFWHHMESSSGIGRKGPIGVNTPPHPQDLLLTYDYTGFQAVYEDTITVTEPGHEWDQTLLQFLRGERNNAVWGIGGHDYHCEGTSNIRLNDVKTVFLVKRKNREAVLNAMRGGRMYAVRQSQKKKYRLSLDEFTIQNGDGSEQVTMGDAIALSEKPDIQIKISATDRKKHKLTLSLVRSGKEIKVITAMTPLNLRFTDNYFEPGKGVFYRLKAFIHGDNYLIANPIFVMFQEGEEEAEERPAEPSTLSSDSPVTEKGKEEEISPKDIPEPILQPKKQLSEKVVLIHDKSVILREGPGTNFKRLGTTVKGERFTLLRTTKSMYNQIPWLKIEDREGREAYLWGGLVKIISRGDKTIGKVIKNGAKIRSRPGLNNNVIRVTASGETFELLGLTKEKYKGQPWYHIRIDEGQTGYIWSALVKNVAP